MAFTLSLISKSVNEFAKNRIKDAKAPCHKNSTIYCALIEFAFLIYGDAITKRRKK
jgi:hypothetical protein